MAGRLGRAIYGLVVGTALVLCSGAVALIGLEVGLRIWDGKPLNPTINFVDLVGNALINPGTGR